VKQGQSGHSHNLWSVWRKNGTFTELEHNDTVAIHPNICSIWNLAQSRAELGCGKVTLDP
jgi:hypothetical protein